VLRPSAQILFPKCKEAPPGDPAAHEACTRRSARPGDGDGVLLVPPSLNTSDLLPLLQPAARRRLWRLDFSDVGSHWHAFRGWHCAGELAAPRPVGVGCAVGLNDLAVESRELAAQRRVTGGKEAGRRDM
jgi:hypothetical protein